MNEDISKSELDSFVKDVSNFESLLLEDQIFVLAYYLQVKTKFSEFNHKNIKNCFQLLDLSLPTNINSRLSKLKTKKQLISCNEGYRIERSKIRKIENEILGKPKLKEISKDLEQLPLLLKKPESDYVKEVVDCLKIDAYHASIVLMWVITISYLRNYVLAFKLSEFNNALTKNPKFFKKNLTVTKYDDFEDIGDTDFLDLLKNARITTKNQHKLLNEKLGIRNTYAHPTNLTLTDTKTISLIEDLINDIITKIK